MSKWEEAGQELEDFVENVYSVLLKNENLKSAKIEKNHIEIGRSGVKHQFDVFYEVKIAGVVHKVGITCKNHDREITEKMVEDFNGELSRLNNIVGCMIYSKGYQEEAKKCAEYNGIKLITTDELPNMYALLTIPLGWLLPDENAYGDPFWTIMELTKDGKNTGSYYSAGGERPMIALFISKKSAELALKASRANGYAVFGVTRAHLRGICLMSKFFKYELGIISTLRLDSYGQSLAFKHSYDQILADYDLE